MYNIMPMNLMGTVQAPLLNARTSKSRNRLQKPHLLSVPAGQIDIFKATREQYCGNEKALIISLSPCGGG
jgi:hypothetical protein